jgi:protein-arginine kinase activator protein McsA
VLVEKAGNYEAFIRKLNPIISKYAIAQAAHAGRKHGKEGNGKNPTNGGSHEN